LIPDGRAVSVESKVALKKMAEEKAKAKTKAPAAGTKGETKGPSKKSLKKAAAGGGEKKGAAAKVGQGELSPTRVVLSDATSGFEIPVSTMVSPPRLARCPLVPSA
jgi:hypothetical protein